MISLNCNFVPNVFKALRYSRIPKCAGQQIVRREISVINTEYGGIDERYAQDCA
jgi:hypothetical protein